MKLDYLMLTKKMDNITAAVMCQESNISLTSQRIILRYLSNFFGSRLVVSEHCIDKLGQDCVIPQCNFFISDHKNLIYGQNLYSKFSLNLLKVYIVKKRSDISQCKSISTIDIAFGGGHGHGHGHGHDKGKMRYVTKFIPRDSLGHKTLSYVIKNAHIDCDHDTYDVLNNSIVKPINDGMKILMNKDMFVYLLWNEDGKLTVQYSTKNDINESSYMKVIETSTRLLISGDLAFLQLL